jgi:NAD(P)-dependent dehydrogenase (short-subunit alcohol dehydrogenase family)
VSALVGKTAIVTGAGTGIGRAIALRLASAGASVALLGRTRASLERVAGEAKGETLVQTADVRDRAAVDAAFDAAANRFGKLHLLVANAGIGGPDAIDGVDRFDDIVRTNLHGAWYSARAFLRHLASGPDPRHIVVISSCIARFGVPGIAAYSAAKAGQLGLVRSLAVELAPQGVRVNAILPGWVETQMAEDRMREIADASGKPFETTRRELTAAVPLQRISEPEEIAGVVEFLTSPAGAAFTGQALDANNGAWMG